MKPDYGTLRAIQRTPGGEIVREHEQPVDSYVENFLKMAQAVWGDTQVSGVTETDGTTSTLEQPSTVGSAFRFDIGSGSTAAGILIGSDGTDETITDTTLGSQLTTNITHAATIISGTSVSGSTVSLTVTRTFTNNTGSSITINEVGLVAFHTVVAGGNGFFLALRDTGDPIEEVAAGNNTTIEIKLTFEV